MLDPILHLVMTLENAGFDVFMQGALKEDGTRSDKYITWFLINTPSTSYYDGKPKFCDYQFQICLYSRDVLEVLPINASAEINSVLHPAGFTSNGDGRPNGFFNNEFSCWINEFYFRRNL